MPGMNPKTKQLIKIAVLLVASGLFLFQGFSLLFSAPEQSKTEKINSAK